MGILYLNNKEFNKETAIQFIISRTSRIAPSYLIAITAYIALSLSINGFPELDLTQIVRLYLFIGSTSVFWSIPPEIQFYGYFMILWYILTKRLNKKPVDIIILTAFTVITFACITTSKYWSGILLPSKLHIFMLGVIGSFLFTSSTIKSNITDNSIIFFILLAFILLSAHTYDKTNIYSNLVFSVTSALIVILSCQSNLLNKILSFPLITFIGKASFSIYLFHGTILRLFETLTNWPNNSNQIKNIIIIILSITIPSLFYFFIEKKLNNKLKFYLSKKINNKPNFNY